MNRVVSRSRGDRPGRVRGLRRATTTSSCAERAHLAREPRDAATRGSRRCSPRSDASSNASPRMRPRPPRCRAGSRSSTRSSWWCPRRRARWWSSASASRRARASDVVEIEGLAKAYGPRVIYAGLDLKIRRTERWCVLGRNGAGKTTLLKLVAGVTEPDGGTVRLGASLKIGYFAQQSLELLEPGLTVLAQLMKAHPAGRSRRAAQPAGRLPVPRR